MFKKGLLKRLVPFFLTLVIGLFVASFFVDLSLPKFNRRYEVRHSCWRSNELMRENQRLREENFRFNQESEINRDFRGNFTVTTDLDESGKSAKFTMRRAEKSLDDLVPPPPLLTPLHK